MQEEISVIIVDDHEIFRFGLRGMIEKIPGMNVLGEASNSSDMFKLFKKEEPDVVFMDIDLGDESGIEITKKVLAKYPMTYVIAITSSDEVSKFKEMIEAGAAAFLLKKITEAELQKAINEVLKGNQYFAKEFLLIARSMTAFQSPQKSNIQISEREKDVLRLVCHGFSNQEIAEKLGVSHHTADAHRRNLISKTGARNTAEMIMIAFRTGLVDPD